MNTQTNNYDDMVSDLSYLSVKEEQERIWIRHEEHETKCKQDAKKQEVKSTQELEEQETEHKHDLDENKINLK